jgi:hypothetical protein
VRRFGLAQDRGEHVAAVNRPPQVDAQGPQPVVHRRFADGGTARADAGVVDHQRGWRREPGLRLFGQRLHVLESRYVATDCDRFRAALRDRICRPLRGRLVYVTAHHRAAALAQFDGEGGTDAATGAGHHRRGAAAGFRSIEQSVQGAEHSQWTSSVTARASCRA